MALRPIYWEVSFRIKGERDDEVDDLTYTVDDDQLDNIRSGLVADDVVVSFEDTDGRKYWIKNEHIKGCMAEKKT